MYFVNFRYGKLYNTNQVPVSHSFQYISENSILTFDLDPRSKVMAPNESPYMISYMYTIQMKSLSLIVSKIVVKIAFVTFDLDLGQRSWHQMKANI